jgi:hypothetical protein
MEQPKWSQRWYENGCKEWKPSLNCKTKSYTDKFPKANVIYPPFLYHDSSHSYRPVFLNKSEDIIRNNETDEETYSKLIKEIDQKRESFNQETKLSLKGLSYRPKLENFDDNILNPEIIITLKEMAKDSSKYTVKEIAEMNFIILYLEQYWMKGKKIDHYSDHCLNFIQIYVK